MNRVLLIFLLVEGVIGFTMGLYLYTYILGISNGIEKAGAPNIGTVTVAWLGLRLTPIEWGIFALAWLNACIAVLELPTGVVADKLGRKVAVIAALVTRAAFFTCLAEAVSVGMGDKDVDASSLVSWGIVAMSFLALSAAMKSGSFIAWFRDHLSYHDKITGGSHYIDRFPIYRARSRMLFHAMFILGTSISVITYTRDRLHSSFYLGAGVSLLGVVLCMAFMPENRQYGYRRSFRELSRRAIKIYFTTRPLWAVTFCSVSVWSVFYVVDAYWLKLFSEHFESHLGKNINSQWIFLIAVVTSASFLGNCILERVTCLPRMAHLATSGIATSQLLVWISIMHGGALLCMATLWFSGLVGKQYWPHFIIMIIVMSLHKVADGASETTLDTLENVYIPDNEQSRSTILSIISLARHLVIGLVFGIELKTGVLQSGVGEAVRDAQHDQINVLWSITGAALILVSASTWGSLTRMRKNRQQSE